LDAYTGQYAPDWAWEVKELSARLRAGGIGHTFTFSREAIAQAFSRMDTFYDGDPDPVVEWTYQSIANRCDFILKHKQVDFADMLYLPIELDVRLPRYDIGIIDEAQDTDSFQQLYASRCFARTVWVGDPNQSIYAFRGADHSAMQIIHNRFACLALPLNITYRCKQAIVDECNSIYPGLIAHNQDEPGEVIRDGSFGEYVEQSNCLILCRNNAPLINLASQMLRDGLPFTITSDFPAKLARYIQKLHCKNITELRTRAMHALEHEQKESAIDRWETLLNLTNRYQTIDSLLLGLKSLIGLKSPRGPLLSTVHKAKGLEAETVVLLRSDLLPSKYAKSDAELRQERNLHYVAVSRAKTHFIYS
ncbi:MAG: ATP-dependent helicase, partial [Candidatus Competibacteraceae bacterium]|nr:ATP-dependent helicase [Candidatus Competibacteraceae bacterium]